MSERRIILITSFLLLLVAGHTHDAFHDDEHWPFSNYPMFRKVHRAEPFSWMRLIGVDQHGADVPITDEHAGVLSYRLNAGVRERWNENPQAAKQAIAAFWRFYEARRTSGRHSGPPLQAMRLCRWTWDFDPQARNVADPSREVLFEIALQQGLR